jgi:uroporphyrinogen-III synthase
MRLLVTRPDPTRTAEVLRARGHDVVAVPLMRIESVAADLSGSFDGVLITSASAARALCDHPQRRELVRLPVLTVGARSAEAVREEGFVSVESADGALGDLVRLAAARFAGRRLLYLAGEDRAGDPAAELSPHEIAVETVVVYRAVAPDALPVEVSRALAENQLDAALHYSRRSAANLLRLADAGRALNAVLSLAHYCLSDEVAAPLREAGARRIFVAKTPAESELIALLPT